MASASAQAPAKHDPQLEKDVVQWVEAITGQHMESLTFGEWLRDGLVLCILVNKIKPGTIKKPNTMKAPSKKMENIAYFTKAAQSLGVPKAALFETLDLYEENNLAAVVRCVVEFAVAVQTSVPEFGGPRLSAESCNKVRAKLNPEPKGQKMTKIISEAEVQEIARIRRIESFLDDFVADKAREEQEKDDHKEEEEEEEKQAPSLGTAARGRASSHSALRGSVRYEEGAEHGQEQAKRRGSRSVPPPQSQAARRGSRASQASALIAKPRRSQASLAPRESSAGSLNSRSSRGSQRSPPPHGRRSEGQALKQQRQSIKSASAVTDDRVFVVPDKSKYNKGDPTAEGEWPESEGPRPLPGDMNELHGKTWEAFKDKHEALAMLILGCAEALDSKKLWEKNAENLFKDLRTATRGAETEALRSAPGRHQVILFMARLAARRPIYRKQAAEVQDLFMDGN